MHVYDTGRSGLTVHRGLKVVVAVLILTVPLRVAAQSPPPVIYTVSLAHPSNHLAHVTVQLGPGASERELQLPVWTSLYQVRDFSQNMDWVKATSPSGQALPLRKLDKSRWRISGAESGAAISYEIFSDQGTPYDAQLNDHHAFFHWAEILMYSVSERTSPVQVKFTDAPSNWKMATPLEGSLAEGIRADNYDRLVDSPIELGTFDESDFDEGGGHYRVVIDADPADYSMQKITPMLRSIVAAETAWMNDRPFQTYLFIYHFPKGPGGGGMEHAFCSAIDVNVNTLTDSPLALPSVSAHEFFHLWNVKRIRPQSLEPIDYSKENYTTSLWFSEGFTSTVEDYALLRAGLMTDKEYFSRLAGQIGELQRRPAHLTQSAEESSLDAWLEKYSYYRVPERSISYYNKGALLGVMLDLKIRAATQGHASLQDLFQWMNQNYARQGRFFAETEGIRQAAEAVSHTDLTDFFRKYAAGTDELPWDDFLQAVGIRLVKKSLSSADLGFVAVRNFNASPTITRLETESNAYRAGLSLGDQIIEINGRIAAADFDERLGQLRPGETIRLKVRDHSGERELHWKLDKREEVQYEVTEIPHATKEQRAQRAAWLKAEDVPSGAAQ
jgi:predicted metalloprotease with PDZ domain